MIEYQKLIAEHRALQELLADQPDAVEIERVRALVAQVRDAGAYIGDPQQRDQLRAILRHWGGIVYERTGEYPATQLVPQAVQPDYPDVAERLEGTGRELELDQLFERASEHEATCQWEEAIEVYREILGVDQYNPKATSLLARANRCAAGGYQGTLVSAAVRVQRWWDRRDRRVQAVLLGLLAIVVLALCVGVAMAAGLLPPTPPSTPTPTPTATTAQALVTPFLTPTFTPTPTDTPSPTPTATLTPTPTPTPTPYSRPYITRIKAVSDPPRPDGKALLYGQSFTETWVLQSANLGPWPEGSKLVFVGGDRMGGPGEQAIEPLPAPGEMLTVSVFFVAPASHGIYEGTWQIQDAEGNPISEPLPVSVIVYEPPPPPPSYPPPELVEASILQCNVTFRWTWPKELAEDEWFALRVGVGEPHSVVWLKEHQFTYTIPREGEYVWEVDICRGDPDTHVCEQLAVSERNSFEFKGCGW
jgi:hypothetical protein